jgi:hypothetical protein
MSAKSETMMEATIAFKQACTTLQRENQEFYRQLLIENQEFHRQLLSDMHTFQMNMFPTVVTTCQQNTINSVTNYQVNSPILDALDTAPSCLDIPPTSDDPKLATNALHTAPSCLDIPSTSTVHSDDPNLAAKPYSTMSTRSISINTSPCGTWKKITLHLAFNVSLSNFSYVDPPIPQLHCLNLPPSRAKKKGVYSYYSI